MRPCASARFLIFGLLSCFAQDGQTAPSTPQDVSSRTDPDHPVHFDVNLVEVDAVVTDSRGNHIDGLSAEDFDVIQDGKRQQITHFRFVPAPGSHGTPAPAPASPSGSPLLKSELRRTFVVFIDDIDTSFSEYAFMRRALLKFVDNELQQGDLWAFYKSTGGSGAWQIFSSDRREIRSAVEHMTWLPPPPIIQLHHLELLERQMIRAISSLGALPGRKTMVLLNSGIYLGFQMGEVLRAIRAVADAANRASVTIEAIDLRGLPVGLGMPDNWADASQLHPADDPLLPSTVIQTGPVADPVVPRPMAYMLSQTLPQRIAEQTGGMFLHDRNDIYDELKTVENDDAGYYLIGWDPGSAAFFGKRYHNLDIKVHRHGLTVRSRAGFFAWPGSPAAKTPNSAGQQMQAALFSPFRSGDIDVELHAGFQHNSRDGSYIESQVHIAPEGIRFEEKSPGCYIANLEIATMPRPLVFDSLDQGHLTSQMTKIEVCGRTAQTILRDGFVYLIRSKIDRPGPYEMRAAVRSTAPGDKPSIGPKTLISRTGTTPPVVKVGSATEFVDVPDFKKNPFALSGIVLALSGAEIPAGIRTGTEGPVFEMSYRAPVAGDPAVREFHAGDTIAYESHLFAGKDVPPSAVVEVLTDGRLLLSESQAFQGTLLRGMYRIEADASPGRYLLSVTADEHPGKKSGRMARQWIDFQVVRPAAARPSAP